MESCANHLCVEERIQTLSRRRTNSNLYHADAGIASLREDAADAPRPHTRDSERGLCRAAASSATATSSPPEVCGSNSTAPTAGSGRARDVDAAAKVLLVARQPARPVPLCNRCNTFERGTSAAATSSVTPLACGHLRAVAGQAESGDVRTGVDLRRPRRVASAPRRPPDSACASIRSPVRRPQDRSGRTSTRLRRCRCPSGFVRKRTSPGRAPALVRMRSGSIAPVTA